MPQSTFSDLFESSDDELFTIPSNDQLVTGFNDLVAAGRAVTADGTPVPAREEELYSIQVFDLDGPEGLRGFFEASFGKAVADEVLGQAQGHDSCDS